MSMVVYCMEHCEVKDAASTYDIIYTHSQHVRHSILAESQNKNICGAYRSHLALLL